MIDFDVRETRRPETRDQLVDALRSDTAVRLAGASSTQDRVPTPSEPVTVVELAALDRIVRLDVADLTVSVEPGVRLAELDAELRSHRMHLPCHDSGTTVGGVFARGGRAALAPGGHHPRSLLLGFSAVLAEGLAFKAGARVVKSVAGFDLAKLYVGSRGRLFATTELHLKLRPLPERDAWFRMPDLDRATAIARFAALRRSPTPLAAIVLQRAEDGTHSIVGCAAGRHDVVREQLTALGVEEIATPEWRVQSSELVSGVIAPNRIEALLEATRSAPISITGGCQFDVAGADQAMFDRLEAAGIAAACTRGSASQRNLHTRLDAAAAGVSARLRAVLDPERCLR